MKGIILCDTREQKNLHILKKLAELNIPFKSKKLDYGDYSFQIGEESFENKICVERKGSIDELIGNFTKGKERFKREFERSKGCKVILMVEASESQIDRHEYRSKMFPSALKGFLRTWCYKFELELKFVEKDRACDFILECFREFIKAERNGK